MRKWSRGLSDWPLTERRGDTYGGQPSVAVDLHGHTAINLSRYGASVLDALGPAVSQPKAFSYKVERADADYGSFTPDVLGTDPQDTVKLRFAGAPLPVPAARSHVHIVIGV